MPQYVKHLAGNNHEEIENTQANIKNHLHIHCKWFFYYA